MTIPVPKFNIGDTVYTLALHRTESMHDCPDCLGTRKWKITSPAGEDHEVDCPRCVGGFIQLRGPSGAIPSLKFVKFVAGTQELTIGSVRIDTNDEHPVSYMAHQTGIGSGNIWYEERLFATSDEAMLAAHTEAARENARLAEMPHVLRGLIFSDLPLYKAAIGLSWYEIYHAWDKARAYREFLDKLNEDEIAFGRLGEGLQYDLEDAMRDRDWCKDHPLEALIRAAQSGDMNQIQDALAKLPRPLPNSVIAKDDEVLT